MLKKLARERLHPIREAYELAVAGAGRLACGGRLREPGPFTCPEAPLLLLKRHKLGAGRHHPELGRVCRPDAGRQRLHEPLEGLAAQPADGKLLERLLFPAPPRRNEPLRQHPQLARGREQRAAENTGEPAGGEEAKTMRHRNRAAPVPHQRPSHPRVDAHKFPLQPQSLHKGDALGPGRQKAIGRSLDEPAVGVPGSQHAAASSGRLDQGHPASGRPGIAHEKLGRGQARESTADDHDAGGRRGERRGVGHWGKPLRRDLYRKQRLAGDRGRQGNRGRLGKR